MKTQIIVLMLAAGFRLTAQDSAMAKIRYGGMQQAGLAFGEHSTTSVLTIINGVRYRSFFAGIGADANFPRTTYVNNMRATAVFADFRYYAGRKKNFFAKVDGGVNFITRVDDGFHYPVVYYDVFAPYNQPSYSLFRGYYGAAGIGVKARLGKEVYYTFDISYVLRQFRYNYHYQDWRYGMQTQRFDLRQSMIQVNVGLEIF